MSIVSLLLKYSRGPAILAIPAAALSGLASVGMLTLINTLLNRGAQPIESWVPWAFAALCVLSPTCRFAASFLLLRMGQRAIYEMRVDLSKKIFSTPLRRLESVGPHRLLAVMTGDVSSITVAVTDLPLLSMALVIIVACLVYLGWLSGLLTVLVLVFMAFGVVSYQLPAIMAARRMRLVREQMDALHEHFRAITDGTKELKIHQPRRRGFLERFRQTAEKLRSSSFTAWTVFEAGASWGHMLFFAVIGLLLIAGPRWVGVDPETRTGFTLTLLYLMTPITYVLEAIPRLVDAGVAMRRVEQLGLSLAQGSRDGEALPAAAAKAGWQVLELAGVTHTYHHAEKEDGKFTLGPVDLSIHRGETLFVTGGNGSGKTTLAKILTGLYTPEQGKITIDGEVVDDQNRERYRQLFSAVFSDFFLFDELLGLDHPDLDERAREFLVDLQLDHKVTVSNGALSTSDLSQGQRKRLALLTAFLEDRSIYLFDELAADQDPHYKEVFYHQLLAGLKARGKTVVVVSHDDRYYDVAQRIVKLEDGQMSHDREAARLNTEIS